MLTLKSSSRLTGLREEMLWALDAATKVFRKFGRDCILTGAKDKGHKDYSLHYKGLAVDIRSKHILNKDKLAVLAELRNALGKNYQVLFENEGLPQEHYHIEYDPKQL